MPGEARVCVRIDYNAGKKDEHTALMFVPGFTSIHRFEVFVHAIVTSIALNA